MTHTQTWADLKDADLDAFVEVMDTFLSLPGPQDASQFPDMQATTVDPVLTHSAEYCANCPSLTQSPPADQLLDEDNAG